MASITNQSARTGANGYGEYVARQTIEFDGGAGSGAVGTVDLFTVTGSITCMVLCVCTEDLTEAGATATVEVGTAASTAALIAQTNAVDIDDSEVWRDNTPAQIEVMTSWGGAIIAGGDDIILTVGAQNVDDGTLVFICFWTPLTVGANVAPA